MARLTWGHERQAEDAHSDCDKHAHAAPDLGRVAYSSRSLSSSPPMTLD